MICPECHGNGRQTISGFVCGTKPQAGRVEIRCSTCRGRGIVPDEMPRWREQGCVITTIRQVHDRSAREFARELGISPRDLNEAEHGRIDPSPIVTKARTWAGSR
jgi:hypothetical protein